MYRNRHPVAAVLIGLPILWSATARAANVRPTVHDTGPVAGQPHTATPPELSMQSGSGNWIAMWDGALANIPTGWGWTMAGLFDRFPYGTDTGENPLGTGGSPTHTHDVNCPNTQTGNDWNDSANRNLLVGLQVADSPHKHNVNFPTVASDPASTLPEHRGKMALLSGDPSSIPAGLIALWSGAIADIPSGWDLCDGVSSHFDTADRFLMGTANGEEPHAVTDSLHVHGVVLPRTTSTTPTSTVTRRGALAHQAAHPNHTHDWQPPMFETAPTEILPPYVELAFLIRSGPLEAAPPGLILMWTGPAGSLPADWVLCDGTNGTPDLRNRFIRGTTGVEEPGSIGGSASHIHAVDPPAVSGSYPSDTVAQGSGASNVAGWAHVHTLDIPQFNSGSGTSIPPYVKLAFVMYLPAALDVAEALGSDRPALHPAVPNPFSRTTSIRFETTHPSAVDLAIYDTIGRRVRSLSASPMEAGSHTLRWDGRDDAGTSVATGVYFVRLRTEGDDITRKLMMIR